MTQETMRRMAEYIALGQQGDRVAARAGLEELWAAAAGADPVTRCGLAHSLADLQDNAQSELVWDLQALTNALEASDTDAEQLGMSDGIAGLMPSLHLNLADVYRRLGQPHVSRGHALQGQLALRTVDPNPYFETVAAGLERVIARLDEGDAN